jgi:NADH dehydrogenase
MTINLVVGATGILGSQIALSLIAKGHPVRALVRTGSNPATVDKLRAAGAEIAVADLKDRASLAAACAGVTNVLITASSTLSRVDGDSIQSVDRDGNLALIDAAKAAGVNHVVFVSFPQLELAFPLQDAKRAVEAALAASGMTYTVIQPPHFWEVWTSPELGFDVAGGKVRIFGDGTGKNSWISLFDVAKAAIASLDNPKAKNKTFTFGGPEPLSQLDLVERFQAATGKPLELDRVPMDALRAQQATSPHDLERSFAALMIVTGEGGWVYDPSEATAALGIELTPIAGHIAHVAAATKS